MKYRPVDNQSSHTYMTVIGVFE